MAGCLVPLSRWFYHVQVSPNAKINVYQSLSTTPVTVYADGDLSTPTTNPVVCDSNGEAVFYVADTLPLRLYVTTSSGTLIRDIDPVYPYPGQYMNNVSPGVAASNGFVVLGPSRNIDYFDIAAPKGNGVFLFPPPGGRLTLTSNTPVTTSDVTAATTIYYTPYNGASLPILSAGQWKLLSSAQDSLTLDSDSGHTGYHQSGKNFDVLATLTGTNTLRIGTGPAWSTDTSRGTGAGTTELEMVNGVLVNKNEMTLRHGNASGNTSTITAREATYLGTIRCTANGQTEDSLAKRFVWNAYNRCPRPMAVLEATNSWNYTTATIRQANDSPANQLDFVLGLQTDAVSAHVAANAANSSVGVELEVLIGLDSTTAMAAGCITGATSSQVANLLVNLSARWRGYPGLGRHFLTWLEYSAATGTTIWLGDNNTPTRLQSGIHGEVLA